MIKNTVDFAERLFGTLTVGGLVLDIDKDMKAVLDCCHKQQDLLNYIIDLLDGIDTPKARYYRAKAYIYSTAEYRPLAIKAIKDYLSHELFDGPYLYTRHSTKYGKNFSADDERNIHLSEMYRDLGKAYEGEYLFDDAFMAYITERNFTPYWCNPYLHISRLLVKQNRLQDALNILTDARTSKYYVPTKYIYEGRVYTDYDFLRGIDTEIQSVRDKIAAGYVYRKKGKRKE